MKTHQTTEFGDLQTPYSLSLQACKKMSEYVNPKSIVEPTCGSGSFLRSASAVFPSCPLLGFDVNPHYVDLCKTINGAKVHCVNFFEQNWQDLLEQLHEPILVIGNPPWVTNSTIGALHGKNLPTKSNFKQVAGLDALTGKSNFDISEWMLIHLLKHLTGRHAVLAMLCKTSVARKVLHYVWQKNFSILKSAIYSIDAFKHFGVAVDACLLVFILQPNATSTECTVYPKLNAVDGLSTIGLRDGYLIANLKLHDSYGYLSGTSSLRWRSGVKHDCARVMELRRTEDGLVNKVGEHLDLESTYIYPLFKSSHLANANTSIPHHVIVTQMFVGEDTLAIEKRAPKTWKYLQSHKKLLEQRASTVYKHKPPFSIFGVGAYSFTPWKVAISGLYKRLDFRCIGPVDGKPAIFDDTCYFMPCRSKYDAVTLTKLLNSETSKHFFASRVFWDAKRPITAQLLSNLNLEKLATDVGMVLTHKKGVVSILSQ